MFGSIFLCTSILNPKIIFWVADKPGSTLYTNMDLVFVEKIVFIYENVEFNAQNE